MTEMKTRFKNAAVLRNECELALAVDYATHWSSKLEISSALQQDTQRTNRCPNPFTCMAFDE